MGDRKINVGSSASFSKTLTETDVYNFARICGDFNPLHVDREKAMNSKFGDRICHGMLVSAFISTVLGMYLPGPGTVYLGQDLKFVAPVYFGDTITATATVKEVDKDVIILETVVKNQKKEKVVVGTAMVKMS